MSFIDEFSSYVNNNEDMEICLLLGSLADNSRRRSDDLSDYDFFIVTPKSDYYLYQIDWLHFYGEPALYFNDPISLGTGTELRVIFTNEIVTDIAIVNLSQFERLKENKIFCEKILGRGSVVIKNKLEPDILKYKLKEDVELSNLEYKLNRTIDEFWIDIYNIYKHIQRKDYFSAKYAFDRRITKLLIFVLEESTKLKTNKDVLFNGRSMNKWLDEEDFFLMNEIYSSTSHGQLVQVINKAILLFDNKMDDIFREYNYSKKSNRNKIVNRIKGKLNDIEI
ncbi:aminoglycoside 6-adenylyltransferase [Shimazuella sp. AN120528]|uniref:aminoglycoside 6-adenylyltransferase n=1 Tax=Shimazuella soli TaxID=1892854 RepID=UPI001F0E691C|nr:aminoglycoside 6-adenylyltransferase [Shimazuella soli]